MKNLTNLLKQVDGLAAKGRQIRITEWTDESDRTLWYVCSEHNSKGEVVGDIFYTKFAESADAWYRLMRPELVRGVA